MDMSKVISEMYDDESMQDYHEAKTKMLSIAVDADHASMLRAIADRFGKSVSAFAGEILENATKEAFFYLSDEDKKTLSEKADQETSDYLKKRGVNATGTDYAGDYEGSRHWQGITHIYLRNQPEGDQ